MFVSKVNDVLICEDIAYKVQNQFVYNNEEYLILMSMIGNLEDVITNSASIYVAKEIPVITRIIIIAIIIIFLLNLIFVIY